MQLHLHHSEASSGFNYGLQVPRVSYRGFRDLILRVESRFSTGPYRVSGGFKSESRFRYGLQVCPRF